jgi:hypothetical protein
VRIEKGRRECLFEDEFDLSAVMIPVSDGDDAMFGKGLLKGLGIMI